MSFPESSGRQPVAASAAPEAPTTLRKSRRLTPGVLEGVSWLMSVVTVGAVVARLFPLRRRRGRGGARGCTRLRRVTSGFEALLRAVAVHVTAHAPAHVERRELIDAFHVLDLPMARLTRDAGVDVTRVREVHVLGELVHAVPRNRNRLRPRAGEYGFLISVLVELVELGAVVRLVAVQGVGGTIGPDRGVAAHAGRPRRQPRIHRLVRRVVTIEAVDTELLHVDAVREVDRLNDGTVLRGR